MNTSTTSQIINYFNRGMHEELQIIRKIISVQRNLVRLHELDFAVVWFFSDLTTSSMTAGNNSISSIFVQTALGIVHDTMSIY